MKPNCEISNYDNIPPELGARIQWVCHKSKIPYDPKTGKKAACNKPATWSTFQVVQRAYSDGGYDGIGFVFTSDDPYVGIDIDHCVDAQGQIQPWAQEFIEGLDSYTEISPSGQGIHIIVKASKPGTSCRRKYKVGEVEMYSEGRYFTFTGDSLDTPPQVVEERQDELNRLYEAIFGSNDQPEFTPAVETTSLSRKNEHLTDEQIVEKASKAKNGDKFRRLWVGNHSGYRSQSEADQSLCNILVFWVGNDPERIDRLFSRSGLYRAEKWGKRKDYRERTIQNAVKATSVTSSLPQATESEENVNDDNISEVERSALFPDVMSGLAGDFAELYSRYLEVPPHFFYMSFLTCLGSILADKLTLASEITPQPRLYVVLLGESADDRKSTAITKTIDFFKSAVASNPLAVRFSVCWGVGSAEGLQKTMKNDQPLLLCFDEFKQFVSKCKIDSSVLLPCVNTLFESNRYESQTKNSSIVLEGAYLSLLAASTVQTYERTWDASFTDIGFNNRLFLVPGSGERKFPIPPKVPEAEKRQLITRLGEVISHVGTGLELVISQKANEKYECWYMNLQGSIHTKRLDAYALRLMTLLAVNDLKDEVDLETVERVLALVDWQLEVRRQHDPIDADTKTAKMEESIRRVLGRGPKTESELKRSTNANRSGLTIFEIAKKNLKNAGEIVQEGKPPKWKIV